MRNDGTGCVRDWVDRSVSDGQFTVGSSFQLEIQVMFVDSKEVRV
jgi:hypothetical protein